MGLLLIVVPAELNLVQPDIQSKILFVEHHWDIFVLLRTYSLYLLFLISCDLLPINRLCFLLQLVDHFSNMLMVAPVALY